MNELKAENKHQKSSQHTGRCLRATMERLHIKETAIWNWHAGPCHKRTHTHLLSNGKVLLRQTETKQCLHYSTIQACHHHMYSAMPFRSRRQLPSDVPALCQKMMHVSLKVSGRRDKFRYMLHFLVLWRRKPRINATAEDVASIHFLVHTSVWML